MQEYLEIILPSGTVFVKTAMIPALIADVLHPKVPAIPRLVIQLTKTTKSGAKGSQLKWRGSLIDDNDWTVLDSIWVHLPKIVFPINEEAWQLYEESFIKDGAHLDWVLAPQFDTPDLNESNQRDAAEGAHKRALALAIRRGQVKALSSDTRLPTKTDLVNPIIPVPVFAQYATEFHINVRVAGSVVELPTMYKDQDAQQAPERYTLHEAAALIEKHGSTCGSVRNIQNMLHESAAEGGLPVYRIGDGEPHEYTVRRKYTGNLGGRVLVGLPPSLFPRGGPYSIFVDPFFDKAYWDDLNDWLDVNVPYSEWRFPYPEAKLTFISSQYNKKPGNKGDLYALGRESGEIQDEIRISGERCSVFRTLENLTADEVSICFVGDKHESGIGAKNLLEISARTVTRRVPFAALDLVDRRQGTLNSQGVILLGMARRQKLTHTVAKAAKMTRLRKVLCSNLGIIGDPFAPYSKGAGWEPRFKLNDNRGVADDRARHEAELRTISLEQMHESGIRSWRFSKPQPSSDLEDDLAENWLRDNDTDEPC